MSIAGEISINGIFVIIGTGQVITSTNGQTWSSPILLDTNNYSRIKIFIINKI